MPEFAISFMSSAIVFWLAASSPIMRIFSFGNDTKKTWEQLLPLVPHPKALALPDIEERATQKPTSI
ncbi:hypothetical protein SAMN05216463_1424 [Xylanibacter ruminicola]|uniref:Uncharacterized protein n=1 Tax=Xylanibacter ruminicola TaxID=839 RepID=A0A1M6Z6Q7_XYLRU|nr:hypothetical protein SAMN05216463_1424 [Xylanibacter ruminicola]